MLRLGGRRSATILDLSVIGYAGPIRFLVAIRPARMKRGTVLHRIALLEHKETPGLGDRIEPGRSGWLARFFGQPLESSTRWRLRRDGGAFDGITGATVTTRAMIETLGATLSGTAASRPSAEE